MSHRFGLMQGLRFSSPTVYQLVAYLFLEVTILIKPTAIGKRPPKLLNEFVCLGYMLNDN